MISAGQDVSADAKLITERCRLNNLRAETLEERDGRPPSGPTLALMFRRHEVASAVPLPNEPI